MRRFLVTVIITQDFYKHGFLIWSAGDMFASGFFASDDSGAEEQARTAYAVKSDAMAGVEYRIDLDELPPETVVSMEKLLALPAIQEHPFTRGSTEACNKVMEELLQAWSHPHIDFDFEELIAPLTICQRVRAHGVDMFVRAYSLHWNGAPFAVVVDINDGDNEGDTDVYILSALFAEQAAHEILQVHLRFQMEEVKRNIAFAVKNQPLPGFPISGFDDQGIGIVDGKLVEPRRRNGA